MVSSLCCMCIMWNYVVHVLCFYDLFIQFISIFLSWKACVLDRLNGA